MTITSLDWQRKTTWIALIIILLSSGVAWIALSRAPAETAVNGDVPSALPRKDFMAPDFTTETLDGRTMVLSELRGQVVLINFWATWCLPCRAEMPAIQQVYEDYRDRGVEVLAVNLSEQDGTVSAFVEELGLTFPVLMDLDDDIGSLYRVRSIPTTFFVDRSGVIREVIVGGPIPSAVIESNLDALLEKEDGT